MCDLYDPDSSDWDDGCYSWYESDDDPVYRRCLLCKANICGDTYYRPLMTLLYFTDKDFQNCCVDCWDMEDALFEEKFQEAFVMRKEDQTRVYDKAEQHLALRLNRDATLGEIGFRNLFALQTDAALVKPAKSIRKI